MNTDFDEQWYLSRYPDVAAAVKAGEMSSALTHYLRHGIAERRYPTANEEQREQAERVAWEILYQGFVDMEGKCASEDKYRCLNIPSFEGKSVLDVGCSGGFFCFKAAQESARRVVGVDHNADLIAAATSRHIQLGLAQDVIEFRCQGWDQLQGEKFDIILFLHGMHCAQSQGRMIGLLADMLTPSGILVLECATVDSDHSEFVTTWHPAIGGVELPTRSKICRILDSYAWKLMGTGISRADDTVPRSIFHVRRLRPIAILLLGNANTGKTTLARMLLRSGIPFLMIDDHVRSLAHHGGSDPRLSSVIRTYYHNEHLDYLYVRIREEGLLGMLFDDIIDAVDRMGSQVSVVEGAIGADFELERTVASLFLERGYFVWRAKSYIETFLGAHGSVGSHETQGCSTLNT